MCWKNHVNRIDNKILQTIGILNKFKHILPWNTLLKIYHLNYAILAWRYKTNHLKKTSDYPMY